MGVQISILKGFYRGETISGIFPLIKSFQTGNRGGFVTIRNLNPKAGTPPIQRISIEENDFVLLDEKGVEIDKNHSVNTPDKVGTIEVVTTNYEEEFVATETEDEAMHRIKDTFEMLNKIVEACAQGIVRGLVVSGPPGVGKSFGVEQTLKNANMFRVLSGKEPRFEVLSGGVSSIGLYQKLYFNKDKDNVLVFDDSDGVFGEEDSLNLLKAALNSSDKRRICWNKESRTLISGNIPESFEFEGSIIFLTNVDFEKSIARGSRIGAHLEAILSRCHYLDLEIGSVRDKLLRIKQITNDGMLRSYNLSSHQEESILEFIFSNSAHLREISLRTVKKIADFVKADPEGWRAMAESTVLLREARFKRLLKSREQDLNGRNLVLFNEV